jgi:magnesium transporter
MITAYRHNGEAVVISAAQPPASLPSDVVWIDMLRPDKAEDHLLEGFLGIDVPTRDDLKDIEPSLHGQGCRVHDGIAGLQG